jgi:hypothetical protein
VRRGDSSSSTRPLGSRSARSHLARARRSQDTARRGHHRLDRENATSNSPGPATEAYWNPRRPACAVREAPGLSATIDLAWAGAEGRTEPNRRHRRGADEECRGSARLALVEAIVADE